MTSSGELGGTGLGALGVGLFLRSLLFSGGLLIARCIQINSSLGTGGCREVTNRSLANRKSELGRTLIVL